jgi:serine/threonine protein kinase
MAMTSRVGRYDVELPLGEGAVGRVLVGRDPVLGRQVAIKLLRDDLAVAEEVRARLAERVRQAARSAASLSHPGLATVHDMGDASDGTGAPFVVFEYLKGPTLRERLGSGPLPPAEVAAIGKTVGAALAHAHSQGVVFGDVKAENILFTGGLEPTAKLTEPAFTWLAWTEAELRDALSAATPAGDAVEALAPAHPAPEVVGTSRATPFSDQFAFAAALYEALTGKRPFGTGTAKERADRMTAGEREPLSVARPTLRSFPHLDTIFDRAFARDPRKRFSSCEVFGSVLATELEGFEAGRMSASSVSSIVPRATRRWQNAVAGLAALVIVGLVFLGRQPRQVGDGASLTGVASAFSSTLAPRTAPAAPSAPSAAHPHAPRATPSSTGSAGPAASAASAPASSLETGAPVADGASASSVSEP